MTTTTPVRRRGTASMRYLEEPVWFRAHGHDCLGLVVDPAGRVFARWFDRGRVHLAWVQHGPPADARGRLDPRAENPTTEDAK